VRALLAAGFLIWLGSLVPAQSLAADTIIKLRALVPTDTQLTADAVASGSLDDQFQPFSKAPGHTLWRDYWLKITPQDPPAVIDMPVVILNTTRGLHAEIVALRNGSAVALPLVTQLPAFLGGRDNLFLLPEGVAATQPLYAHLTSNSSSRQYLSVSLGALDSTLALGRERARMIALTFGALMSVSLAALLIWFVLKDPLFILYATLFTLQALYVAFISGQGFAWPVLSYGAGLDAFAWNVPVALSGAVACLFTREIADLKRFSPRVYRAFGWFAVAFVILGAANLAEFVGLLNVVNAVGNVMFIVAPVFTVIVCFMAWRRGNRAAGWFLIAWCLRRLHHCRGGALAGIVSRCGWAVLLRLAAIDGGSLDLGGARRGGSSARPARGAVRGGAPCADRSPDRRAQPPVTDRTARCRVRSRQSARFADSVVVHRS